jgi:LuxR family maltose regulon positive regulatory protein
LGQADQIARQSQVDQWVLCWLDDCHLKTWLAEGNVGAVRQWAESCGLTPDGPLSYQHDLHHQNLARALVIRGSRTGDLTSLAQAAALLTRLRSAASQAGWVHEEIKILVLQAVNEQARGCRPEALQSLSRAVSLAEPGGYVQVFLAEGEPVRELLGVLAKDLHSSPLWEQMAPEKQPAQMKKYLAGLLAAFDRPAGASATSRDTRPPISSEQLVEPLSAREMDVLKLLAQGCSDKQIATALTISTGTVNKHLKNIYGKLDVHSRTEALAQARNLGLM